EAAERALAEFLDELPRLFNRRCTSEREVNRYVARVNSDPAFRAKLRERLDHGEAGGPRLLSALYWVHDARTPHPPPPLPPPPPPALLPPLGPARPQRVLGRPPSLQGRRAARRLRGARPAGIPVRVDPARPRTLVQVRPLRPPPAQGTAAPGGAGVVHGEDPV